MKKFYPFNIIILLSIIASSCLDEISYNNDTIYNRININGQFTNDSTEQTVEIRKVSNFGQGSPSIGDPIVDAEVFVLENKNKRIDFIYTENGIYKTNIAGTIGNNYQLIVKQNGKEYSSDIQTMQQNAKIESARLEPVKESIILSSGNIGVKNTCTVRITTNLNDGKKPINVFYRFFSMYEFPEEDVRLAPPLRTCFIEHRNDIGKLNILTGKDFSNNRLEDYKIYTVDHDYKFYYKYLIRIEQYAIDSASFSYWDKVKELTKPDRSIFDPPAGPINSNIKSTDPKDQPFGFFTVSSKEIFYLHTNSTKLGFVGENFCRVPGVTFNNRRKECIDCRLFPKSTTTMPPFWPL
jgi:hypothetical protein